MHTRMKVHESKYRSKQLRIREGSAFYVHMVNDHPDEELEGKPIDTYFEVNILKAYQKVLTRLVDEGTNLNSHNGPILNSKTEWHQPKIIRNIIIQGGAEAVKGNMGLRPNSSPQHSGIVTSVVQQLPAQESSRDTRKRHRDERGRGI